MEWEYSLPRPTGRWRQELEYATLASVLTIFDWPQNVRFTLCVHFSGSDSPFGLMSSFEIKKKLAQNSVGITDDISVISELKLVLKLKKEKRRKERKPVSLVA